MNRSSKRQGRSNHRVADATPQSQPQSQSTQQSVDIGHSMQDMNIEGIGMYYPSFSGSGIESIQGASHLHAAPVPTFSDHPNFTHSFNQPGDFSDLIQTPHFTTQQTFTSTPSLNLHQSLTPNIPTIIAQADDSSLEREQEDLREDDSTDREQENERLLQLKDEQGLAWRDIRQAFRIEFGKYYSIAALQMRYRRLRRRFLLDFSNADQAALLNAYEYWETKRWDIISAKMREFGATDSWTPKACATAWRNLQQGVSASRRHSPAGRSQSEGDGTI